MHICIVILLSQAYRTIMGDSVRYDERITEIKDRSKKTSGRPAPAITTEPEGMGRSRKKCLSCV